jgi:hypothetical protein
VVAVVLVVMILAVPSVLARVVPLVQVEHHRLPMMVIPEDLVVVVVAAVTLLDLQAMVAAQYLTARRVTAVVALHLLMAVVAAYRVSMAPTVVVLEAIIQERSQAA